MTDPCELWTAEDVSAAMGGGEFTIQHASSGAPICGFVGTKKAGDLTQTLVAGFVFGDASTGSLIDVVRSNYPDSPELDVGGMPAIAGTTYPGAGAAKGWSMSSLYVFPDPMIMVEIDATAPKGVDAAKALVGLAQLAAPRIATVQRPAASPSPSTSPATSVAPSPSTEARTGLAALFPTVIGGSPTTISMDLTGPEFLSQIVNFRPEEQRLTRALAKQKKKPSDLSFVIGTSANGSVIGAFQVKDTAVKPLVNALLESLAMERTGDPVAPDEVAGKAAFGIMGGFLIGGQGFAYPKDDVLWLVFPTPDEQAEVFGQLP